MFTLKIKKQGGGITGHIGDPKDKRGIFTPKGGKKPTKEEVKAIKKKRK
jgi:hypothetical protein